MKNNNHQSLLLTLGHNSSAILTNDKTGTISGYEQERLTRIKSSSVFPIDAINACMEPSLGGLNGFNGTVYVSHWFDDYDFHKNGFKDKHWVPLRSGMKIKTLSPKFTHHDAHAWSAIAFFKAHDPESTEPQHIAVADGFGNREEVFSLYSWQPGAFSAPKLERRIYGYSRSLGLMYQYATSFCGMKENQDEYKFLGYESHIREIDGVNTEPILEKAFTMASQMFYGTSNISKNDHYIDVDKLMAVKATWHRVFADVIKTARAGQPLTQKETRCIVGFFIQAIIENFYGAAIKSFDIKNIIVTGGLHYNVKLNNHIMKLVEGTICAMPLAGDQGAAIGLYAADHDGIFPYFGTLCWGRRSLRIPRTANGDQFIDNMWYFDSESDYVDFIVGCIRKDQLVNTITSHMEFGPRALTHTSTLARPSERNVDAINQSNGRDTVMPFAPVMTKVSAPEFFHESDMSRVVGSLEYMILTLDYHSTIDKKRYRGIMHPYPDGKAFSGRPQIVEKHSVIGKILGGVRETSDYAALINTSLNVHGVPIVFSVKDAIHDMRYNQKMATKLNLKQPVLVVGDFTH